MTSEPVYKGFYDHDIDTYLTTDVSSKSVEHDVLNAPIIAVGKGG